MAHRFSIGQRVRFRSSGLLIAAGVGSFKIITVMPVERDGEHQYRIKSEVENFERVATEDQLSLTV